MGDLILADFKGKSRKYEKVSTEPVIYLTEQEVQTLADMQAEGIAIMSSALIPHYHEGDSGDCA